MLFGVAKRSGSRCELKNIKKIRVKLSKKHDYYIRYSSISDYYPSIYSDSNWYKLRQSTERKEMNKLYHVEKNNNKNKDQTNDAIEYEQNFDCTFILSSGTKDPLPVITVSLRGGKKYRSTIITSLTCIWVSRATYIMIKSRHTKPYKHNMRSNNVECITYVGPYCIAHQVKAPICIPSFFRSRIISHRFHVDNNEVESGIGYDMIIGRDLVV